MSPSGSYNSSFSFLGLLHAKANSFQLTAILAKDSQARKLGDPLLLPPMLEGCQGKPIYSSTIHAVVRKIRKERINMSIPCHNYRLPHERQLGWKELGQPIIAHSQVGGCQEKPKDQHNIVGLSKLRRPFLTIIAGFLGRQLGRKVQAHHHCSLPRRKVARKSQQASVPSLPS